MVYVLFQQVVSRLYDIDLHMLLIRILVGFITRICWGEGDEFLFNQIYARFGPVYVVRMKPTRPSLLIIGHGSSSSSAAEEAVRKHVETLKLSNRFWQVSSHFLMQGGQAPEVPAGEVFLLPFFMSDGYFVNTKIPEVFDLKDFKSETEKGSLYQCAAIGVDPELSDILFEMAMDCAEANSFAPLETDILLVAHGSEKNDASFKAAVMQRDKLNLRRAFKSIDVAFLEQEPSISSVLQRVSENGKRVICLGLFASDGPHASEDVPAEINDWIESQASGLFQVYYEGPVGNRPEIVKLIQDSVSRCAAMVNPS